MLKLSELENWISRGFSGLYNMALKRATEFRHVPVQPDTITRLKSLREEFVLAIDELAKFPEGDISPDEWDAQHIACFNSLLQVLKLRMKYGSQVRGSAIVKALHVEIARMDGIIRGYEKLNQRLIP